VLKVIQAQQALKVQQEHKEIPDQAQQAQQALKVIQAQQALKVLQVHKAQQDQV
jgi:hypothetical protein